MRHRDQRVPGVAEQLLLLGVDVGGPEDDRELRDLLRTFSFLLVLTGIGGILGGLLVDVDRTWTFQSLYLIDAASFLPALLDGLDDELRKEIESGLAGRAVGLQRAVRAVGCERCTDQGAELNERLIEVACLALNL